MSEPAPSNIGEEAYKKLGLPGPYRPPKQVEAEPGYSGPPPVDVNTADPSEGDLATPAIGARRAAGQAGKLKAVPETGNSGRPEEKTHPLFRRVQIGKPPATASATAAKPPSVAGVESFDGALNDLLRSGESLAQSLRSLNRGENEPYPPAISDASKLRQLASAWCDEADRFERGWFAGDYLDFRQIIELDTVAYQQFVESTPVKAPRWRQDDVLHIEFRLHGLRNRRDRVRA